jgi:rhodanese-related sulfurtransferase
MRAYELLQRIESKSSPLIIDARSPVEYTAGHIPGAITAPVLKILRNTASLPEAMNRDVVITCRHGPRAKIARWLLARRGWRHVDLLEGHMRVWRNAGLPMETRPG